MKSEREGTLSGRFWLEECPAPMPILLKRLHLLPDASKPPEQDTGGEDAGA